MKSYESVIVTTANNIQDTDKDQLQFFAGVYISLRYGYTV